MVATRRLSVSPRGEPLAMCVTGFVLLLDSALGVWLLRALLRNPPTPGSDTREPFRLAV